jgi:hypothetical protein
MSHVARRRSLVLIFNYAELDYVNDAAEKYVFPETDIAFTVSLEQLPTQSGTALRNILPGVRLGTLHLEPVPENYPWMPRGLLCRIEHRKVDYLGGFDAIARGTSGISASFERMTPAHNPLMFPSLYVLRKTSRQLLPGDRLPKRRIA